MNIDELNQKLTAAMAELAEMNPQGINIHGKRYTTVAKRVEVFRKHFGLFGAVSTSVKHVDDISVRVEAQIYAYIGSEYHPLATGHAEEVRLATTINKTSALEVCETSAIGRALACLGLHGGEYASANEVEHAIAKQEQPTSRPSPVAAPHKPHPVSGSTKDENRSPHKLKEDLLFSMHGGEMAGDDPMRAHDVVRTVASWSNEEKLAVWKILDSSTRTSYDKFKQIDLKQTPPMLANGRGASA